MEPLLIAATAYIAVLTAELIGDKMVFTVASLSARYRPAVVLAGLLPAQMLKMGAAVLAGDVIRRLPPLVVAAVSVCTFAATAAYLWPREGAAPPAPAAAPEPDGRRGVLLAFSAVFLAEWGDVGQLTAAALTARFHLPLVVWCAATAAMVTKSVLAVWLGFGLRRYVPRRKARVAAAVVCMVMAVLSAFNVR